MVRDNLKNRGTVGCLWRTGWCQASFSPPLSFYASLSVSSSLSLQLFRAGWVSQTAPLFRPLTGSLSFCLPPLFGSLPSTFPKFTFQSVLYLLVHLCTDCTDWVGGGMFERAVTCFPCCSWLLLCLCLICWSFKFATVTIQFFVQSGLLYVLMLHVMLIQQVNHNITAVNNF